MERQHITRAELRASRASHRAAAKARSAAAVHPVLALQARVGNRAAARFVQAKLRVGPPADVYEQEADRVADHVMRMPEHPAMSDAPAGVAARGGLVLRRCACGGTCASCRGGESEAPLHRVEAGAGPGFAPPFVHEVLASHGRPLEAGTRAWMEERLGADLGGVRVHTGARAAESARAVNAHAYTVGREVVFGAGRYAPGTRDGNRLLAHELTHVMQQRGGRGARLQRSIIVGGKPYTPTAKYLGWLKTNFGDAMVEFINSMHNGGMPPEFEFDSFEKMGYEVRVRHNAIKGMEKVHQGCCGYPTGGGTGHLDTTHWDKAGFFQFTVKTPLPAGKEASDAVEAIFAPGAGTELECNSTMVAIQYRAMLLALGKDAFNKKFPGGAGIIISPHHRPPAGVPVHPIWDKKLYREVTITSSADLLPGDWVYFKNVPDYISKHPGGFWTGEHAMYLGGGKFRGFGVAEQSETDLKKELLREYNNGLPAAEQKALADVPGLQDYARRPVISEITK